MFRVVVSNDDNKEVGMVNGVEDFISATCPYYDIANSEAVMQYIQSQCNKNNGTHHMSRMVLSVTQYMIWKEMNARRLLEVDPMKRMTIPEIHQHQWFKVHLPHYLAVPPPDILQQAKKIDEKILQEVVNMGFDRNQLVESLINRVQNEGTVTYYLLWVNRYRVSSDYLGDKFQETTDSGLNPIHPGEVTSAFGGQQFPVEGKRALGVESRVQPREILDEVLKALQKLNVCSKQIGHYKMKCRWVVISDHQREMINKFELQLYKTQEKKYLLDLQRLEGPQILFSDLCAAFLVQLRVL